MAGDDRTRACKEVTNGCLVVGAASGNIRFDAALGVANAGTMATCSLAEHDRLGAMRRLIAPWVAAARGELGEVAFRRALAAGRALSLEAALAEAAGLSAAWSWAESCDPANKCTQQTQ